MVHHLVKLPEVTHVPVLLLGQLETIRSSQRPAPEMAIVPVGQVAVRVAELEVSVVI